MSQDAAAEPGRYAVDGMVPSRVEIPGDVDELCRVLKDAHAAAEASIIWGGGTRIHVGNIPERYDVAVDLTRLDRVVEHEPGDLTIVAEAGLTLAALHSHVAGSGLWLPFDPPRPDAATIGGSVASNAAGPLRGGFGSVREMILGMKVIQPDGTVTRTGGKVVKNVQGYDLHRLHVGAIGTLGVIAEIAFKLLPLPAATGAVAAWFDDLEGAAAAAKQVLGGSFAPEALSVYVGPTAAGLIRGLAPPGNGADASHLLLVRLAGGTATVARQTTILTGAAGTAGAAGYEVLHGGDGSAAWETVAADQAEPLVAARATLKPSDAFEYLAALETAAAPGPLALDGAVHAGFGTVVARWTPRDRADGDQDAARTAALAAFAEARSRGAAAVIETCPVEMKKTLDVYGELGPELDIMRRLKAQFDPGRNLSPGRFAGRI